MSLHDLLLKQIAEYTEFESLDQLPEALRPLFAAINKTYVESSGNMRDLERSVADSAEELHERNKQLRDDLAKRKSAEKELRTSQGELRAQKQLFENLVAIARATTQRPTLEGTLQSTLLVAKDLTLAEHGSLFILDEIGRVTHSVRSDVLEVKHKRHDHTSMVITEGLAGWVIQNETLALVDDINEDDRWAAAEDQLYQPQSALCLPIMHGRSLIGVMTLTSSKRSQFTQKDTVLMQSAADQMALALTNAQIYEQQVRLAERQWAIYGLLQTLGSLLNLDQVLQTAVNSVVDLTSWPTAVVFLADADGEHLVVRAQSGDTGVEPGFRLSRNQGITGRTFRIGQTQYVANALLDPDNIDMHKEPLPHSELAVPLQRGQRKLGVLHIEGEPEATFMPDDIMMAELVADAIALAIDNALLYNEAYEAKIAAEEANLAKSQFVSVASHELKTPMTVIRGFADLMSKGFMGTVTPKQTESLLTILHNVQHMDTLVSDLTDISRMESGQLKLTLGEVQLPELIKEVEASIYGPMQEKEQTLVVKVPAIMTPVLADRTRLVQILNNLVSNAYKYTPIGGKVTMWAEQSRNEWDEEGAPEVIHVVIKDTGIGIREEEQARLFEQFFRSDDEKAQESPGTGLGLNITKNLVEAQGGKIWFESEFRKGTAFHFTIPLSVAEETVSTVAEIG